MIKHLSLFLATTALFLLPNIAHAQTYTPSNRTPVADNSQIGTQVSGTNNSFNIDGGLQRGQNLFHSFTDFSIPTGGAANFTNPAGNRSIITRVTGNLFSDLNGTLNTNGANFLLINPNGVVFGTDARLNVGKAFVTSTANGIDFVDVAGRNYNFGVNRAGDAPLISIAPNVAFTPARLIMGGTIPGNKGIENYGTLQTNNPGQYIGLIGGDVTFRGGQLIAPGTKVELGGLVQSGTIGFSLDNGVQFPANVERGNVSLVPSGTSPSVIDIRAGGGGNVGIVAKDITIQGTGTRIRAGISAGLGSSTATVGDIKLDATGNIKLSDRAAIINIVSPKAEGKGGGIEIVTPTLSIINGAALDVSTDGKGDAGNIKITATGNVYLDRGDAFSTVGTGAEGKGGEIEIVTPSLSIINGAGLTTDTFGKGDAGNIKITATGNVSFDRGDAFSRVEKGGEGKGGGIEIVASNLSVTNGAQISASIKGKGDAGNIKIAATGDVAFDRGAALFSAVEKGGEGKGGGIEIVASNLSVTNGAQLVADTSGKGDAGNIKITTTGNVSFDGGVAVFSAVQEGSAGKGGGIEIVTFNLSVINGAQLIANTFGTGDAGNIKITATGNVSFDGIKDGFRSVAASTVEEGSQGKGGEIKIVTSNLSVTNGAVLTSGTSGKGDGGNIKINATRNVSFNRGYALSGVAEGAEGKGGGIEILTPNIFVTNSATLTASTEGKGDAGNIFLKSNNITLNKGNISSKSTSSTGGDINIITTDYLLMRNNSIIATDSQSTGKNGNGGNITISSPLIIATPGNNDITANANQGDGGRVNITSQGLFGIQYRPTGSLFTNDITASSTFGQSGNVQINTPGIDPGKDTGELPAAPNDASRQISQTCGASQRDNKFYITGRGGLPPNASEPQESEALWQDARATETKPATTANQPAQLAPPAIGWVFGKNGQVRLIAAQTAGGTTAIRVVCPSKK
jgi:filamentous hemagglutinin family protein